MEQLSKMQRSVHLILHDFADHDFAHHDFARSDVAKS